jgi:hypothetical protein
MSEIVDIDRVRLLIYYKVHVDHDLFYFIANGA